VKLGNWVKLGNRVTLGKDVKLGEGVTLGNDVKLGEGVTLGEGVKLGEGVTAVHDLGVADGYRVALALVDGNAFIGGGCKFMSLHDAIAYVANKPERAEILNRIIYASEMATRLGWKWEKNND
jgi:UDP-3-O-[3-hydroxymyristoyl] glucosamine N-acyltransferase